MSFPMSCCNQSSKSERRVNMPKNPLSALLSKLYTIFKKKQLKNPRIIRYGEPS